MSSRAGLERTDKIGLRRTNDHMMRAVKTGRDVFDEAVDRARRVLQTYEHYAVCFSGGKDSTCVLETTILAAEHEGMLPVPTIFLDDEAMPPQVVDYALRVRTRSEVDFRWYAFPIESNNA